MIRDHINVSRLKRVEGRWMKSCPCCSRRERRAVFHPIEDFGERTVRGRVHLQTWCKQCRSAASHKKEA